MGRRKEADLSHAKCQSCGQEGVRMFPVYGGTWAVVEMRPRWAIVNGGYAEYQGEALVEHRCPDVAATPMEDRCLLGTKPEEQP